MGLKSSISGPFCDSGRRLAKLRSLFVIAQGTVFALHERGIGAEEAGRLLNVDYVVSGPTRVRGTRLTVTVELAETRSARIVWAEIFNLTFDDAFVVLDEIGNRIVALIASEIETLERHRGTHAEGGARRIDQRAHPFDRTEPELRARSL